MLCIVDGCTNERGGTYRACRSHYKWKAKYGTYEGWENRQRARPPRYGVSPAGFRLDKDGYEVIMRDGKQVARHRAIMEESLGRLLRPDESVHHKNGVKHDNNIDNLELWSRYQPAGQRVADKLEYAREILRIYG